MGEAHPPREADFTAGEPVGEAVEVGQDRVGLSGVNCQVGNRHSPLFGTVEVTIEELAELLERQVPPRDQDAAPH